MKVLVRSVILLTSFLLLSSVALGQSAAEWKRFKEDCRRRGGTICDTYNDCDGRCTMPDNSRGGNGGYQPPAPPDPLPRLANDYRTLRSWFTPEVFPDAPALVEPANLTELYRALNLLNQFARNRLWSLRDRKATLDREYQELQDRIRRNTDLTFSLQNQIANLENEISRNTKETEDTEAALRSQQERQSQLTAVLTQIEDESRSTRLSVFEQLHSAAERGWIQPPSSYHPLPVPLAPEYSSAGSPVAVVAYQPAPLTAQAAPQRFVPFAAEAARPAAPRAIPITEQEVQQRIQEISNLRTDIYNAANSLNETAARVGNLRRSDTSSSDTVRSLRERLDLRTAAGNLAVNTLNAAKAKLRDAVAEYQRRSDQLPIQCLELAFWHAYKERVRDAIKNAFPDVKDVLPAVDTTSLSRLTKVMTHVIQLQKETFAVIARVPNAMIADDESPLELKKELDAVVGRFKVNLVNDLTGFKLFKFVPEKS